MERKKIVVLSGAGISVESGIETIPGSVLVNRKSRSLVLSILLKKKRRSE